MIDQVVFYLDNLSPAIQRGMTELGGSEFDITPDMQFRLRIRELHGSDVILDVQMAPNVTEDTVTYSPQTGQIPGEGLYRAWIVLQLGSGVEQDTDEFDLIVLAHAPGQGTRTGTIARAAEALVPVAWSSLRGFRNYGDTELQRQIDLAKLRVLRTVASVEQENQLDPRVVDYLAKKVLVDNVLGAAIDFWTNQVTQRTARSNSEEIESYPDRISAAEKQLDRFRDDLERQQAEVEEILGTPTGPILPGPALDSYDGLITPGLEDFPSPYPYACGPVRGGEW